MKSLSGLDFYIVFTLLLIILFTLVLESDNRLLSPNFPFRLFNQCRRDTAFQTPTSIVRP